MTVRSLARGSQARPTTRLSLPGLSGNYITTPDRAALNPANDIDVRVKWAPTDWTPPAINAMVAKRSGVELTGWYFVLLTTGVLRGAWGNTVAATAQDSTAATGFTDGTTRWCRWTLDTSLTNAISNFYTSNDATNNPDAVSWTQLGTANVTTVGAASISSNANALAIGAIPTGNGSVAIGSFHVVAVYDGVNGTKVTHVDFTVEAAGGLIVPDRVSGQWTRQGTAALVA